MDRLSPVSSVTSSSGDGEDEIFEVDQMPIDELQQPLSPPPESSSRSGVSSASYSNKRRAPGGPISQPFSKFRGRRGDDHTKGWNHQRIGRAGGPEARREELLDVEFAKYLRRGDRYNSLFVHVGIHPSFHFEAIGDPFEHNSIHPSTS
jgi:hypothetical protein